MQVLEHIKMTIRSCLSIIPLMPRASILMQVLERTQMTPLSRVTTIKRTLYVTTILMQVFECIQVTTESCTTTNHRFFPGAAILVGKLEHIQVTPRCCPVTSLLIPRAFLAPEPLQYLQMTTLSCPPACLFIHRAVLVPEPLQYLQVTTLSCTCACFFIPPTAASAPEPFHDLEMAAFTGIGKEFLIQLEPILSFQPLQGLELASARYEEEKEVRIQTRRRRDCEKEDLPAALVISGLSFGAALRSSCSRGR